MLDLLLIALGAYRLWRLAAVDQITEPLRSRVIYREGTFWQWVSDGLQCAWCLGFWLTALTYAVWQWVPYGHVPVTVLALSTVVGLISTRVDT